MAEVELFTVSNSPYEQRMRIALTEKKIPFKLMTVDLRSKPQGLLEANPVHKNVPAIIHNGRPVAESLLILDYLEDAFPEQVPLMPNDAFEKSKVRFLADYIDKAFSTMIKNFWTKPGAPDRQAAIEESVNNLKTLDEGMTNFSAVGPFSAGDKSGLLDVVLAPLCSFHLVFKEVSGIIIPGPQELPRLHKWIDVVKVDPSVSSTLPPEKEPLRHVQALLKRRAVAAAAIPS